MTDRLHRRGAHLLALAATRGRFCLGFLTVVLPETRVHITFNIGCVFENVGHYSLLERPPEEIQLAHRGLLDLRLVADLERNALAAAERIKQTLAVGFELALVLEMDNELFAV